MFSEEDRKNLRKIFEMVYHGEPQKLHSRDFHPFLNPHLPVRTYPKGSILVRTGDPATTTYLIVRGRCHLTRASGDGAAIVVDDLKPPIFQGIAPALNGLGIHMSNVVADRECLVLLFQTSYLLQGLEADGTCAMDVIRDLALATGRLRSRMDAATTASSEESLLLYIYRQYFVHGAPEGDFYLVDNKNKMAAAVGVSLRTLYRSIERLEADHRVRLAYRGLMVPEAEMKRIVAHFSSNGVPGSLEK